MVYLVNVWYSLGLSRGKLILELICPVFPFPYSLGHVVFPFFWQKLQILMILAAASLNVTCNYFQLSCFFNVFVPFSSCFLLVIFAFLLWQLIDFDTRMMYFSLDSGPHLFFALNIFGSLIFFLV